MKLASVVLTASLTVIAGAIVWAGSEMYKNYKEFKDTLSEVEKKHKTRIKELEEELASTPSDTFEGRMRRAEIMDEMCAIQEEICKIVEEAGDRMSAKNSVFTS